MDKKNNIIAKDKGKTFKLAKEFKFNLVLFGVYDAEAAIKEIKDSGYPGIRKSPNQNPW